MPHWPIVLSIPHAGLLVPPELEDGLLLDGAALLHESDEGSELIYQAVESRVAAIRSFAYSRTLSPRTGPATINHPFPGGYLTRSQPGGIPWVQLELNAGSFMSTEQKTQAFEAALIGLCETIFD